MRLFLIFNETSWFKVNKSQENVRKIKIGTWQGKLAFIYDWKKDKSRLQLCVVRVSNCPGTFPSVYTRISSFLSWITNNVQN
jgi:hypothetical protein